MARYRIGNDITIIWTVNDRNGAALPLADKDVRLFYTCERGRYQAEITIQDTNKVVWDFHGGLQKALGGYSLTLEILQSDGKRSIKKDVCNAFLLVAKDCEADAKETTTNGELAVYQEQITTNLDIARISPIIPVIVEDENGVGYWYVDGVNTGERANGESAYDYAVSKGYEGTEEEYAELLAAVGEKPDWLADNKDEAGYIKNRTHYIKGKVVTTLGTYDCPTGKILFQEKVVELPEDGTVITLINYANQLFVRYIKDAQIISVFNENSNTGESGLLQSFPIKIISEIVPLPDMYIPESIARKSEIPTKLSQLEQDIEIGGEGTLDSEVVSSTEPTEEFPQVLYTPQSLTESQKSQARKNIGVGSGGGSYDDTELRDEIAELSAEVGKKLTGQWVETSGLVVSYAPTGGGIVKNTIDVELLEGDILNIVKTNADNTYTFFILTAISKDGQSQNILQAQGSSILVGNWGEIVVPFDTIKLQFQSYAKSNVDIIYTRRYWESLDVKFLKEELTKEGSLGAEMLNKKRFIASINPHGAGAGDIIETHVSLKKGDILGIERVNPMENYNYFILKIEDESGNQSIVFQSQDAIIGEWDNIIIPFDAVKILINGYPAARINIFLTRQSKKAESEHDYLESRWSGKKWLLIGDSISTEWEEYVKIGYGNLIAKYFNFGLLNNIAKSGKSMNDFYAEVDKYAVDYDLVTIMLGTNNQGYNTAIGSLNDEQYQNGTAVNNNESFIASMQMLYEKLSQKYPNAKIVFITPIRRCSTGEQNAYDVNVLGLTTEDYANAIKEVCRYYAIPCIDIYDCISPLFADIREKYFINADGTHPNEAAHAKFIAPIIAGELFKFAPFVA